LQEQIRSLEDENAERDQAEEEKLQLLLNEERE
jgi:hypothetical protein